MTRLFLCEKPSQARDIARVLGANGKGDGCLQGDGVTVTWCFGHLLEMASPEVYGEQYKHWSLETLPILPMDWRLEVKRDARKQFGIIKALLSKAGEVVIATDADREGEMIAREVLQLCRWSGPLSRLWLSALDETSIRKALDSLCPGEQTQPLYWAGLGRSRADWLVGMNLTRAYTVLGRERGHAGVLSVGRVQTPTLRLVVDRDRDIDSFQPVPYWDVLVTFDTDGGRFRAKWVPRQEISDAEGRCINEQAARTLAQQLSGRHGSVTSIETKRGHELPPLPYDLGTLQQEADKRFGMGAQQVLDTVQALYESHKAVTYPRTDCPYLPESMLAEASAVLEAMTRSDPELVQTVSNADLNQRSRAWNDGKITAHHAIIPTTAPADITRMGDGERKVYDLIRRRYLAQFYPAHEFDKTLACLSVEQNIFKATGRRIVAEGWKSLYQSSREDGDDDTDGMSTDGRYSGASGDSAPVQDLPQLSSEATCPVVGAEVTAKHTKPPARFTEGTLIAAMKNVAKLITDERLRQVLRETSGIGTEATRAGIIKTLLDRGFMMKRKNNLISTDTGRALVDALPDPVKDPGTTALWEQALDDIAQGRGHLDEFVQRQAEWVAAMVSRAKQSGDLGGMSVEQHPCPECGKPLRRRKGKSGFFWGCSGYPECQISLTDSGGKPGRRRDEAVGTCQCGSDIHESPKAWQCKACNSIVWKESFGKKVTEKQALSLLAGEQVVLKGLKSKAGKKFDAGARITDGKLTLFFDANKGEAESRSQSMSQNSRRQASAGDSCPECGKGTLVQRTMKSGKNEGSPFLGCSNYPKCRYFSWMPQR